MDRSTTSRDTRGVVKNVVIKEKQSFEQEVLVWVAFGPNSLSLAFIRKSAYAINAQRYLKECIKCKLIPYICANYAQGLCILPGLPRLPTLNSIPASIDNYGNEDCIEIKLVCTSLPEL
uniref:Uncharacterized protein n=1 Tax=Romanomermis culicivorax TaxID=13658 RepID=A0A915IDQ4_ROMCU